IAEHFEASRPPPPPPPPPAAPPATLERGRRLVVDGDPARGLPACVACHGDALLGAQPAVPGLLGLPRDYLNAQFGAWREGTRRAMAPDCMATVARRLTVDDVESSRMIAAPLHLLDCCVETDNANAIIVTS
ncbi:MAG TPA: hypothetical protein PKC20_08950, partial [Burkholderiaceae bacterium]|nr:hypothetical protein [Burkholderiaceae bacterium]